MTEHSGAFDCSRLVFPVISFPLKAGIPTVTDADANSNPTNREQAKRRLKPVSVGLGFELLLGVPLRVCLSDRLPIHKILLAAHPARGRPLEVTAWWGD